MATYYSEQLAKVNGSSRSPLNKGEGWTDVKSKRWTLNTADDVTGTLAEGDHFELVLIPKGARIRGGKILFEAMGTDMTADIGLKGADGSGYIDAAGTVADDPDFFTSTPLDVSAAGEDTFGDTLGDNYDYQLEKDCYLTVTTDDTGGADAWADDKDFNGYIDFICGLFYS